MEFVYINSVTHALFTVDVKDTEDIWTLLENVRFRFWYQFPCRQAVQICCCAGIASNKGWIMACEDMTTCGTHSMKIGCLNHKVSSCQAYGRVGVANRLPLVYWERNVAGNITTLAGRGSYDVSTKYMGGTELSSTESMTACAYFYMMFHRIGFFNSLGFPTRSPIP
jgi:hypothetical protein